MKNYNSYKTFILGIGLIFSFSWALASPDSSQDGGGHARGEPTTESGPENDSATLARKEAQELYTAIVKKVNGAVGSGQTNWDENGRLQYELPGEGPLAQSLGTAILQQNPGFNPQSQAFKSSVLSLTVTKEGKLIVFHGKQAYQFNPDGKVIRQ